MSVAVRSSLAIPERHSAPIHLTNPTPDPTPRSRRALLTSRKTDGTATWTVVHSRPFPAIGKTQVLVRNVAVGLNPFDWQSVQYGFGVGVDPKAMGRDGAGDVIAVGSEVQDIRIGDRVWFCANPANVHSGAFQDLSVHSADEVGLIPSHLSYDDGATLGSGIITAAVVLFKTLGLSLSDLEHGVSKPGEWLLVWGGAGATGVFLIQLARRLGYRVICAASPVNHDYLIALGAEVVLDRWLSHEALTDAIRRATGDEVKLAIDNVGSKTAGLCAQVLGGSRSWRQGAGVIFEGETSSTATLVAIAGSAPVVPSTNTDTSDTSDQVRQVLTPRVSFSTTYFGHPEFSRPLLLVLSDLLAEKAVVPTRLSVLQGGIYGIKDGLDILRDRAGVGGHKLVLRL